METKKHFLKALSITLKHEGIYSADRLDPGGETYCGISRVYWPYWSGWLLIDAWIATGSPAPDLTNEIREFYFTNFWCRFQGDKIAEISPGVACELFDTAVNLDVPDAVRFLQIGHNVGSGQAYPLVVDGLLGPKTMETIRRYLSMQPGTPELNEEILLNCMNGEQYIFYKNNPDHKRYRGWFRRV